jgi:sugar (pentulose or hexulose) kinase/phosphoglycerate dehydrogenase-like enzyme/ribulose-5-phosphate 4-epimerase/fuculose-1-phosphate aldolase/putative sterol carrier protein
LSEGLLLGLDLGGSGVRALLLDPARGTVAAARRACPARATPHGGGLGFDLDLSQVWAALAGAAREAIAGAGARPESVRGVAAGSMRFATAVLDAQDAPLLAVPNRDARAAGEALWLAREHGEALHARTGLWPAPLMTAPRLLWLARQRPELWSRARRVLSLSDWITGALCGEWATEPTQAGTTLLFELAGAVWSDEWLERLQVPARLLPPVGRPGQAVGALRPEAAETLGLRPGIPVALAGADSQLALLGVGALAPGELGVVTGTTAPIQLVLDRPLTGGDGRLWAGHHPLPDRFVLESNGGPMGESLDWLARALHPQAPEPVARLLAEAQHAPPGAAGLFSTFGAQVMNARDLSLPVGHLVLCHLTSDDQGARPALSRAVVEGLAFAVRANREVLARAAGAAPGALFATGGLSRSALWTQLLADVLDAPLRVAASPETSAFGAALCAAVGAGVFPDLESAARALARPGRTALPDPERAARYDELYRSWAQLRDEQSGASAAASALATPIALRRAGGPADAADAAEAPPRPRILVTADLDRESLDALGRLGEVEAASFRERMRLLSGPALVEALRGFQVFVTEVDLLDAAALEALPELRVVAACRGDAVNVDVEACSAFGVPVLTAPGRNAEAVADLTLAFLLMLARKLPAATGFLRRPDVRAGDMAKMGQAFSTLRGRELGGATVGLVGLGAVGRAVARRLAAFGARVLVADPFVSDEDAALAGARRVSLERLLSESDFVSLHAAVTDKTRGLLGAAEIARMKPGAFLVNTARAALVDEAALLAALREGRLAGAALDAFAVEPPGADHPLLQLDSVIATPHVGGNSAEVPRHQGRIVAEALAELLRGRAPRALRNPEVLPGFDWSAPRPRPDPERLRALAARPKPAVSDLQRDARPAREEAAEEITAAPEELIEGMRRVAREFVARVSSDPKVRDFSKDRDVTLHFRLSDLGIEFFVSLRDGRVEGSLGPPAGPADVQLRMRAAILDGMFTGRVNAMELAMQGEISFTGDAGKAMTLQQLQRDFQRLYREAREAAGDPGDLESASPPAAPTTAPAQAAGPDDPRPEIVAAVNELYASQLVTATGGNVSARIPGRDEIWITPSQLFKGDLRPEVLVRTDLEGRSLDAGARSPSSEWSMHCAIYRARPEVRAVVHAHAPHATILANSGLPFLPISTEAAFFADLPRLPFVMPGTRDLADAVVEALGAGWALLMVNHGLLVAARSLRRAADMTEIIDRSAEVILGCYAVGREPPVLPPDVVATLRKMGDLVA